MNNKLTVDIDFYYESRGENRLRSLIASIILLAVQDLKYENRKRSALNYFHGDVFNEHCNLLGINHDAVREKIVSRINLESVE